MRASIQLGTEDEPLVLSFSARQAPQWEFIEPILSVASEAPVGRLVESGMRERRVNEGEEMKRKR